MFKKNQVLNPGSENLALSLSLSLSLYIYIYIWSHRTRRQPFTSLLYKRHWLPAVLSWDTKHDVSVWKYWLALLQDVFGIFLKCAYGLIPFTLFLAQDYLKWTGTTANSMVSQFLLLWTTRLESVTVRHYATISSIKSNPQIYLFSSLLLFNC